ncbi:transcription initiation factor TFIID subunit 4b-like isoform X2 [Oryza brachyantha]|uniref:transcription initiation factor TFIID subunit 4b-like isoform X2 n=1 Tax=Oryza brachyantha TaxID=4533 RepID=UPI0007762E3A|nr:transcription initiation factor TFIID subunit 4b-like isoform X2 [Oryza brachyantha]
MDPLIRFLDDDVDETMHSGADVEAFTAALNREVEGSGSASTSAAASSSSSSQPLDRGAGLVPQESNSIINHNHEKWQDSVKNKIGNEDSHQQEQKHSHHTNEQLSRPEVVSGDADNKHLQSNSQKEDQPKVKQEPGNSSQQTIACQKQPLQQITSQQTPTTSQTNSAPAVGKPPVVTFHMLIPILRRYLDKDKDMQVQSIFTKLRKNEVSKEHFLKVVRTIVGDKLLKQAAAQYQVQAAHGQRNPQTNPSNYSLLSQVSNQQSVANSSISGAEQKSYPSAHSIPGNQATDSPRPPPFRPSLSGQMQSNMGYPSSESNLQKVNESGNMSDVKGGQMLRRPPNIHSVPVQATQHHVQRPQASLPVLGTNNIHARPFPRPVGGPVVPLRPQIAESSQRGQSVQGVAGSMAARPTLQTNLSPWQQANKEQKTKSFTPTEHMNKIQPATQTPPPAATSKTPQKKTSAGQKKPLDALGSSPPPSSKKQKTSGGYHDQSIDQLNDVTAVSGVNLREEEEQLFSAPKEESRVSEAARKVVQLEEEKLILQKGPLTKRLAEIMRKCNLKSMGSDVDRCLSMCVEERLRGFISNAIRLSKQRVDLEKSRHRIYPLSSDVRSHILRVNREAREQWEKKLAEDAERIRKQNDGDDNAVADSEKDKNENRSTSKHAKTYKAEDDKMRTTAANAAARVAAGGDDMFSRWQLIAEQNKQSKGGDGSSSSMPGNMLPHKSSPRPGKGSREQQEFEKTGGVRRSSHVKVTRSITVKDVIAALEREPQMLKSSLLFQLYGRSTESSPK